MAYHPSKVQDTKTGHDYCYNCIYDNNYLEHWCTELYCTEALVWCTVLYWAVGGQWQLAEAEKLWYNVLYCTVLYCVYRVSFYELLVDNGSWQKQKSSGVMICPGTGSTSWHLNVNHVSFQAVQEILQVGKNDSSQLSCTVDCKNGQKLIYSEMPRPV